MRLSHHSMHTDCRKAFIVAFLALGMLVGGLEEAAAEGCARLMAQADDVGSGELSTYPRMTENGTVARREFKGSDGRIVKTIYYHRSRDLQDLGDTLSESDLVVSEIRLHGYNELGREVRMELYSPDMRLQRVQEITYTPDGRIDRRVWLSERCIRTDEIRYLEDMTTSHLYFDDAGKALVGIRGSIPSDMDLRDGWGEASGFLSCGVAPTKRRASVREMQMNVTVRNLGQSSVGLPMPIYSDIRAEVRSSDGVLIPPGRVRTRKPKGGPAPDDDQATAMTSLAPGKAVHYLHLLKDSHPDLKPGRYLVTYNHPVPGRGKQLVSNTTEIEIIEEKPSVSR